MIISDPMKALGAYLEVRNIVESALADPAVREPGREAEEYHQALKTTHTILESHIEVIEQRMMGVD